MTQNTAGLAAHPSSFGSGATPGRGAQGGRGRVTTAGAKVSEARTGPAAVWARSFVSREFFHLAHDRCRKFRQSTRAQKLAAAAMMVVLGSVSFATAGYVVQRMTIATSDREIPSQRQAYFDLQQEHRHTLARKTELEARIAQLEVSLAGEVERREALQRQRDALGHRSLRLERSLTALRDSKLEVIDRLIDRVKLGSEVIEKTVAMTGLDAGTLNTGLIQPDLRQGGPLVDAGDKITDFQSSVELAARATELDLLVDRWTAMEQLVRSLPITTPLDQYWISSGYGVRRDPINGRKARHLGVDFAAELHSGVLATAPGEVVFAGWHSKYGHMIRIDHGHGIQTLYGHLSKIKVETGDRVLHRQEIGLLGNSGRSTGPHLHYEIRFNGEPQDPMKFLKAGKHIFKG